MDTAALKYLFFGEEDDSDSEGVGDPFGEWIKRSIELGVSEKTLILQLDQIERWMYLENVWYFRILKFSEQLVSYPIFLEYVSRRNKQWEGKYFSEEEASALIQRVLTQI